ncbi:MAG: NAD(P)-dependent oxidoreductase [Methylacidiphilales bacterium]|nr:NAD(P)-dependent oxidoreductase [Candidatus Methylacidiphilales bacterium]
MTSKTIAFIGVGVMGGAMASHLAKAGYSLRLFNRTKEKVNQWLKLNPGYVATSISEACDGADYVITCVNTVAEVREVILGDSGALASMPTGSMIIDHSTTAPSLSRAIYDQAQSKNIYAFDAPVSGGAEGARLGTLVCMVGGDAGKFDDLKKVSSSYCKLIKLMGGAGIGNQTKLVNQLCIAGVLAGISEGLSYGKSAEVDLSLALPLLIQGAAGSWQMQHRGETILENKFNHGFSIKNMVKDLELFLDACGDTKSNYPNALEVLRRYKQLCELGNSELDTSSLILSYNNNPQSN